MSTLISKIYNNKKSWYIVDNTTQNGKQKRVYLENLGHISKTEAKMMLANFVSINKNRNIMNKIIIKKAVEEFKDYYRNQVGDNIKQRTYDLFEYNSLKIIEYIGYIEITKVDFNTIESMKIKLKKNKLSPRVINMLLTDLKKVLEYAVSRKWLNDFPKINRLSEVKKEKVIDALTKKEFELLLEYANDSQSFYLKLMLYTGMRPHEASQLTWGNVNLKEKCINVLSDNKFKSGRRIPLHPILCEMLELVASSFSANDKVSPYSDSQLARKSMKRLENTIYNSTKVENENGDVNKEGIRISCNPYKLRKSFGSLLAQSGVDTINVAHLMGHSKLQTTYQYYIRLENDNLRKTIEML